MNLNALVTAVNGLARFKSRTKGDIAVASSDLYRINQIDVEK
jgi:hypothetical protein